MAQQHRTPDSMDAPEFRHSEMSENIHVRNLFLNRSTSANFVTVPSLSPVPSCGDYGVSVSFALGLSPAK